VHPGHVCPAAVRKPELLLSAALAAAVREGACALWAAPFRTLKCVSTLQKQQCHVVCVTVVLRKMSHALRQ